MLAYVRQPHDEGLGYDGERAKEDSRAPLGTDERTFIRIFIDRSSSQLAGDISDCPDLSVNSFEEVYIYFLSNLIFLFLFF